MVVRMMHQFTSAHISIPMVFLSGDQWFVFMWPKFPSIPMFILKTMRLHDKFEKCTIEGEPCKLCGITQRVRKAPSCKCLSAEAPAMESWNALTALFSCRGEIGGLTKLDLCPSTFLLQQVFNPLTGSAEVLLLDE